MSKNPLQIIQTTEQSHPGSRKLSKRRELEAKFERLWLLDPEQFNPLRNCMQRERLERTWNLLTYHTQLEKKKIVDLGCGSGVFSRRMRDGGGIIEAVDIAENALKYFRVDDEHSIQTHRDAMPETNLPDENYDIVSAMDLIAELPVEDYRLFFAELARIIKPSGWLLCSSPIDIYTEGGVDKLINLAQTEFDIEEVKKSYHALHLRLKNIFSMPAIFLAAWKNKNRREKELAARSGLNKWWFYLNSSFIFFWIWFLINPLTKPLLALLKNNRSLLFSLENICEFISNDSGVSHVIFLAKRRPINMNTESENIPLERPKKREVWE
jgi:2-polyprenyl-3-methyl-5-hydroxy-6-metoxy-1,4-benzoquinol methylase